MSLISIPLCTPTACFYSRHYSLFFKILCWNNMFITPTFSYMTSYEVTAHTFQELWSRILLVFFPFSVFSKRNHRILKLRCPNFNVWIFEDPKQWSLQPQYTWSTIPLHFLCLCPTQFFGTIVLYFWIWNYLVHKTYKFMSRDILFGCCNWGWGYYWL